jgi:hypothetical protein
MGEVSRARDTKPNREVAVKVLPELYARDADGISRFTRVARAVAALIRIPGRVKRPIRPW